MELIKDNINHAMEEWMLFCNKYKAMERQLEEKVQRISGLGLNEFYLLHRLAEQKPLYKMRMSDAVEESVLSQSAMSRLVKRLEIGEEPILMRSICEEDSRAVYIRLTSVGMKLYTSILKEIGELLLTFSKNI